MRYLRTNTATRITVGPFLDKTDGVTPETAITVTGEKMTFIVDTGGVPTLILDTAPTASGGSNDMVHVTGDDAGFYDLELAAADVNYLGRAMLALTDATVHCPVFHEFMILPAVIYDAMILGTELFDVSVTQWLGTAAATPTVAGVPEVDITHVGGDAQSATDLKDFADAGYDPATNKVEGVKLADTLTTYTGNTVQTGDSFARIGAAGAGLTDLGGMSTTMKAQVQTEAEDALVVHRLDELLNADSDIDGAAPPVVGSVVHEMLSKTAGSFTYDQTTDSNEAIRDNMGTAQTGDSFARLGAPAAASVSADILAIDNLVDDLESRLGTPSNFGSGANVSANLVDIESQTDDIGVAGAGLTDLGGMSATMKAQVESEVDDALGAGTGTALTAIPWNAAWDAEIESEALDALNTILLDSIPADGTLPTARQALYMIAQFLMERAVSGTTLTVKKADGSTTLMTFTLSDATTPTSITRAT